MGTPLLNLTDSQMSALKEFKFRISDILGPYDTDAILLKWLRARNYHVKKAELYYREFNAINKCYELDTLYDSYTKPEAAEKHEYTAILGFAKNGSVVRYSQLGLGDHIGLLNSISTYDCMVYACSLAHEDLIRQREENARTGKDINEITYIFDLEGLSIQDLLHKSVLEMGLDMGSMVQDYYPEIWGNVFFINVPSFTDVAYNLFKPILRLQVIQKIKIVSKEHVPQVLLRYIDEDVLPAFLGGKRVDCNGNPKCTEFLRFGGKIPEKYYIRNRAPLSLEDSSVTSVWVPARGVYNYSLLVTQAGTRIHVQYHTENGSILLRKLYRKITDFDNPAIPTTDEYLDERDEKTDVLLISPEMRVQSHIVPLDYTNFVAPWAGLYIFRFSNTHNWFGARKLTFRIRRLETNI